MNEAFPRRILGRRLASGLTAALAAVLLVGCPGAPDTESATGVAPEVRAGLEAVPEPSLSGLPEVAGEQINGQRQALDALGADAGAEELARAYGRLGELYHAYTLTRPALVAYANARSLEPDNARLAYLEAAALQREGRTDEARDAYARALELKPGDRATQLHLAEVHMALAEVDAADALYTQVLEADPTNTAGVFGRGRVAEARGEFAEAARDYEAALGAQPSAKNLHSLLASLYRRLDDMEGVERHLAQFGGGTVVFDDPVLDSMKSLVGGIGPTLKSALDAFGDKDFLAAADLYLEVLETDADNATALSGAANSLRRAGELDRAVSVFRRFVDARPENRIAQLELATSLMENGEMDEALERFAALTESAPDFEEAHFNHGVALTRAGRWADSIQSFRTALELEPRNQPARFHLALALEETGSIDAALATLKRAVQEAPSFVRARQRLGALLESQGRIDEAAEHFQAVAELEEAPQQERALALYQLGRLRALGDQSQAAIQNFEQAIEWMPELWQAHIALGRRLLATGQPVRAAESFGRAASINPEHVAARVEEAQSLILAGRYGDARLRLEAGLTALPQAAEIAHTLARLLATAPDPSVRNGDGALALAAGVLEAYPWPSHAETYVMALAELGRFDEAVERQRQLIQGAQAEGRNADLPRLQQHLQAFQARQPVRLVAPGSAG
ncbi:MAG: tetratricopeptide repeat protein [Acidobacteriota bacterium]